MQDLSHAVTGAFRAQGVGGSIPATSPGTSNLGRSGPGVAVGCSALSGPSRPGGGCSGSRSPDLRKSRSYDKGVITGAEREALDVPLPTKLDKAIAKLDKVIAKLGKAIVRHGKVIAIGEASILAGFATALAVLPVTNFFGFTSSTARAAAQYSLPLLPVFLATVPIAALAYGLSKRRR